MKKIHDFKKALEQKQKQIEAKTKHFSDDGDIDREVKKIAGDMVQMYKAAVEDYKVLADKYKFSADFCQELATDLKERQSDYIKISSQVDLLIHFIIQSGLEDEYIQFLNDVKVNEENPDYSQAAIDQLETHDFGLFDEYGMIREEDKYFHVEVN